MKLWASLYLMIWLAFLEFMILLARIQGLALLVELHILLGVIIILLAFYNAARLRATQAPARIKRIAGALAGMATFEAVLGLPLYFDIGGNLLRVLHLIVAFAILAQASSVATTYDMWEEKEFAPPSGSPPGKAERPAD